MKENKISKIYLGLILTQIAYWVLFYLFMKYYN